MEKAAEILKKAAITLEKYKKNKTLVSPEDLAGKYKVPFEKLKAQLKQELTAYLAAHTLGELVFVQDNKGYLEEFIKANDRIFKESNTGKLVGKAAFKEYDLEKVKQLAEALRIRVYNEAWVPYFTKHICLYLTDGCLAEENPQTPRIYNSLVDMFWDARNSEWIKDDAAKQPAILVYIQEKTQEGEQYEQK